MDFTSVFRGEGLMRALELTGNAVDIGEHMAIISNSTGRLIIINLDTGKWREFVSEYRDLRITDDEIDFDAMEKGCPHYKRPCKYLSYSGLGRWDDFKDGICALSWMVYPDGRYFADEDGYGMEDNSEENAYCIIDRDLNIIVPFRPYKDIRQALEEMRAARR